MRPRLWRTDAASEPLRLLTITELAKALGVGVETARALVRPGERASVRCGRDPKVPRPCVERYFAQLQDGAFERARRPPRRAAGRVRRLLRPFLRPFGVPTRPRPSPRVATLSSK